MPAECPECGGEMVAGAAAAEVETEQEGYADRTNEVLRADLESRGLDTTGKKAEMVARLEANDAEPVGETADATGTDGDGSTE